MPNDSFIDTRGLSFDEDPLTDTTMKLPLLRVPKTPGRTVAILQVTAGPDMLSYVKLEANEAVSIGRDESCGLTLRDGSVSRKHATVTYFGPSDVEVIDHASTNGTAINGHPVTSRAPLSDTATLEIGAVLMRLDYVSQDELRHLDDIQRRVAQAGSDALTGLYTRRWMEEELPSLLERWAMSPAPISCLFLDIDHFKRVNDTWGHGIGDTVLAAVSRLVMHCVRDSDPCIRYGGEEMLVVLPGSDKRSALDVAERIRRRVQGHDWERTTAGLRVTASIGVAEHELGEVQARWLDRADKALYTAKREGRNRVRVA